MYNFLCVYKFNNLFVSGFILPRIRELLQKYRNVLTDDYCSESFDEFLTRVQPHLYAGFMDGEFLGFVYLTDWRGGKNDYHSCTMTVCIEKKYWGKVSKEISKLFIRKVFEHYGLFKLKALVFEHNRNAGNFLLSLGFKKEALLRGETVKNGKPVNMFVYSVFKEDYR